MSTVGTAEGNFGYANISGANAPQLTSAAAHPEECAFTGVTKNLTGINQSQGADVTIDTTAGAEAINLNAPGLYEIEAKATATLGAFADPVEAALWDVANAATLDAVGVQNTAAVALSCGVSLKAVVEVLQSDTLPIQVALSLEDAQSTATLDDIVVTVKKLK